MLLQQDKLILFFDTETTGLMDKSLPLEERACIVQLAYITGMYNGESVDVIDRKNIMCKPLVPIHPKAQEVHGFSDEDVANCPPFKDIAGDFFRAIMEADIIVWHNIKFDIDMVEAEAEKIWPDDWKREAFISKLRKKSVCTMMPSIQLCKCPFPSGKRGYKWPKLTELYKFLFNKEVENAHDALGDITATMECFVELHQRKILTII